MNFKINIIFLIILFGTVAQGYDDTIMNHDSIYNTQSTSTAIYNLGGESTPISVADKPNGKQDDLDVSIEFHDHDDHESSNESEESPLVIATRDDDYDKIQELLELPNHESIYVDDQDEEGRSALHYAAFHDSQDIAILLLDHGANINISDNEGFTPLHLAADQNSFEVAQLLIDAGADLNKQTVEELKIPFDYAHNDRMKNILKAVEKENLEEKNYGLVGV